MITRKYITSLVVLVALSSVFLSMAYCKALESAEHQDVFVHENIHIDATSTVGRVMVAGGNAIVGGKVTEDIFIVDGNLAIESSARVLGKIVILGGGVIAQQGAEVKQQAWIIAPQGHPLVPILIGTLFILAAISLLIIPALVWILGHYFKRTAWYTTVKEKFFEIEQRWPALYIALSLLVSAIMLTLFTELAWETIFRNAMVTFDNIFIWLIRYFNSPIVDQVMIRISDVGFGVSYIIIVCISFLTLAFYRRWREIGALAICLIGGAALNFLLKYLFKRSRPDFFSVVQETGFSFPSGHAMASMCFFGMADFLIMRNLPSWRGRLMVMTGAVIIVVAIGISRIYLGVHYPSDVVAGYAAGSMWLAFCISLLMLWERKRKSTKG